MKEGRVRRVPITGRCAKGTGAARLEVGRACPYPARIAVAADNPYSSVPGVASDGLVAASGECEPGTGNGEPI